MHTNLVGFFVMLVGNPKVFMIGWEYPPHNSGGLGVACQGLTEALAESNTSIYFSLPYALPTQPGHMQVMTTIHPSWSAGQSGPQTAPPFLAYAAAQPSRHVAQPASLDRYKLAQLPQSEMEQKVTQYAELVAKSAQAHVQDYDVLHAHDWMSFPAAIAAKAKTHKPMIAHVHSTEYDRIPNGHGSNFIMHSEYEGMMAADKIIAVSNYTKRLLTAKYAVPSSKIEVVHNGMIFSPQVDPGAHHFAQNRQVVVFMGRLTGQKGPEYFVQLARHVVKQRPNVLFVMAGQGDMYQHLLLKTAEAGLSASVLFTGFVRDAQRETLLDRADVFVMPSLSEPFGLVALEAAERHTPVIVSKNAGVSEVLPSGIAIDFWDLHKMTETIVEILDNHQHRQGVVSRQLGELHHVTWQRAATRVNDIYRSVFAGRT